MSLKSLNKTQKSAVEAIDGPVLIFAGAEGTPIANEVTIKTIPAWNRDNSIPMA